MKTWLFLRVLLPAALSALILAPLQLHAEPAAGKAETGRQRLIVLSDIGADPDDAQSMVRLLLYSDDIDIEGLVATTSVWQRERVRPELIRRVVDAYGKVVGNLRLHDPDFPGARQLDARISQGQPRYGMEGVGEGMDSPGSEAIIRELDRADDRPLWVTAWGGVSTLAQALYKLRATRSPDDLARLVAKLRVHTISDQDDAGLWIRKNFPKLFYIVAPGGDYGQSTWIAINSVIDGIDNRTISNGWLAANIQQSHGPLGAAYPDVAWGMEGDTPSWLALIPNGLNAPDHPDWGSWGGRYELYTPAPLSRDPANQVAGVIFDPETRPIWTTAKDAYGPPEKPEYGRATRQGKMIATDAKATLWRWRDAFQNDFAARMDWTVKPYAKANHPPVVKLDGSAAITVKSGQGFGLSAKGTFDPDDDSLSYYWFDYPEAGTYPEPVAISGAEDSEGAYIVAPEVTEPQTLHFILAVTDKGSPPLTRYARVVVTVEP